jgi:signal transduction histidine kinase
MARVEAGMVDLQEETIDVAILIRETVILARGSVPGTTHRFDIRLPDATPLLMADRRRMKQVLINLIGNAVKFTPSDGRIRVAVGGDERHMSIAITDTGIGIPPEKIGDLGQPFSQIESTTSRRYQGSGMGLFITKSLVERHGGDMEIESRLGEGTTVTIRLPSDRLVPVSGNPAFLTHA